MPDLDVLFRLFQQFSPTGRRSRETEAEKVERDERDNRGYDGERCEGDDGRESVGQDVPHDNRDVVFARGNRGSDVVFGLLTVEFAANVIGDAHPSEGRENTSQQQETGAEDGRKDDDGVQKRDGSPDFHEPLPDDVDPAAVVAENGTRQNAKGVGDAGDHQREADGNAVAVSEPHEDVSGAVVGAEPVCGRRSMRRRAFQFEKPFVGVVGNGREEDVVAARFLFGEFSFQLAVVGFSLARETVVGHLLEYFGQIDLLAANVVFLDVKTKCVVQIGSCRRKVIRTVVTDDDRPVVHDEGQKKMTAHRCRQAAESCSTRASIGENAAAASGREKDAFLASWEGTALFKPNAGID